jgi:DNA-binding transcriptional LysR family regulator
MTAPGTPTFDQLRIFLAIADTGSFAGAGRKLKRAVSVISYGIANLEAQLGLTLFLREGTRKPQLTAGVEGVECIAAGSTAMAPVAAPDHPLGRMERIPPGAGREYTQLVLMDRSRFTEGRDYAVMSPKTWRLADLGAKHALLREGIGWGNMPLPMIDADLVAGTLKRLMMPDHPGGTYRFAGIWRRDTPPGPAASWLLEQFVALGAHDRALAGIGDI